MNYNNRTRIDFYLNSYDHARKEILVRHDFLFKVYALALIGIFTLLKFAIENPELYFLVPVFTSFNIVIFLYNLGAKSLLASYC